MSVSKTYSTRSNARRAGAAYVAGSADTFEVVAVDGGFAYTITTPEVVGNTESIVLEAVLGTSNQEVSVTEEATTPTEQVEDTNTPTEVVEEQDEAARAEFEAKVAELKARREELVAELATLDVELKGFNARVQNRSTIESPVKVCREIFLAMEGAARKDVVNACIERGVRKATAATQFQVNKGKLAAGEIEFPVDGEEGGEEE